MFVREKYIMCIKDIVYMTETIMLVTQYLIVSDK